MDLSLAKTLESSEELIDIEKHFKLYAGPGAGKTKFLINHINNIIYNSSRLGRIKKIACITYTNTGVNTIKSRLNNASEYVEVSTIHSFLYKNVLKPYSWLIKKIYNTSPKKIDGHDIIIPRYSIVNKWKSITKQMYLNDFEQLKKDLSKLKWNLDEGLECKLSIKYCNSKINKNSYIEYKKLCWEEGLISHDDVLFLSFEILKRFKRIIEVIRAKFPYILIDEFQDTSPIQAEILKLLGKNESIIGVIGDVAQSIFSFQGAEPIKFQEFNLKNLVEYKLENNYRSTNEIIQVLNHLRDDRDFIQISLKDEKLGTKPTVIVCSSYIALEEVKRITNNEVYTIAYKNEIAFQMKTNIDKEYEPIDYNEIFFNDSNKERSWIIIFIIKAVENAMVSNFKDAIKYMKKAYRKTKEFTAKDALINLKRLIDDYNKYKDTSIKDFYNNYIFNYYGVKNKISRGKVINFYSRIKYINVTLGLGLFEDNSYFKTIHKAKGEEYKNVLVVIPEENEEKSLEFILKQNIEKNEVHRVYYVACSRAKEKLFINVPSLSKENSDYLEKIGFKIIRIN